MGDRRSIPTTKFLPSFFHNSIFSPFSFVFQVPLYKTHFFCSLFLSSISYFSGRLKFHYRRHISFITFPPSCLYRFSFVGWSPEPIPRTFPLFPDILDIRTQYRKRERQSQMSFAERRLRNPAIFDTYFFLPRLSICLRVPFRRAWFHG